MNKRRELLFKIISLLFSAFVFVLGAFLLFWFDIVDFNWSRQLKKDYQYERSKSMGKRLLVLGDSQLEKEIADQSLFKHLRNFCEEHEIGYANAAHFGYGTIENSRVFHEMAFDYEPDLVILFYNFHNDLADVLYRSEEDSMELSHGVFIEEQKEKEEVAAISIEDVVQSEPVIEANPITNPERPTDHVPNETKIDDFDWELFKNHGIHPDIIRYAQNRILDQYAKGPEYVNPHVLVLAQWQPDYLFYNITLKGNEAKNSWYRALQLLEGMLQIVDVLKCKFVIVGLPSTVQVDTSHYDFYRKLKMSVGSELLNSRAPQNLMDSFCLASNIGWIDLLPPMKHSSDTIQFYYGNDDHLNDAGQTLAYQIVERQVLNPYLNGSLPLWNKEREKNYYKKYTNWHRAYRMEVLENRLGIK